MSLKEEIRKIEEEEEAQEEEAQEGENIVRLRDWETEDKIKGLYQRVNVIIEYIDNQTNDGVTTITEQQLKEEEQHFREEGIRKAWELKNLELSLKIKNLERMLEGETEVINRKEPISDGEIERLKEAEYELKLNQLTQRDKNEEENARIKKVYDRIMSKLDHNAKVTGLGGYLPEGFDDLEPMMHITFDDKYELVFNPKYVNFRALHGRDV